MSNSYLNIEDLSQHIIVLISCYSLGGAKSSIHTEDIGFKSYKLNKNAFSWKLKKYEKFPDMTIIRKSLDRAKKNGLLIGSYSQDLLKDGWKLSINGIEEVEKYKHFLKLKKTKIKLTSKDKKFLKKFTNNKYYKDFLKNNSFEINIFELADILGSAAGNANHIRSKFYDYKSLCLISSDKNLILFMNEIEKKFPEVLNEKLLQQQHMASNKKLGNIL